MVSDQPITDEEESPKAIRTKAAKPNSSSSMQPPAKSSVQSPDKIEVEEHHIHLPSLKDAAQLASSTTNRPKGPEQPKEDDTKEFTYNNLPTKIANVSKPKTEEEIDLAIAIATGDVQTTVKNGFKVVGKSAPASPENFDPEKGRELAYEDAFRQLWPLEGYLLRERLAAGNKE